MNRETTLDNTQTPREPLTVATEAAAERPSSVADTPSDADFETARPENRDDYAAIRAAAFAMSGRDAAADASVETPKNDDAPSAGTAPQAEDAASPPQGGDADSPIITDDSPDVLAAQADDVASETKTPAPADADPSAPPAATTLSADGGPLPAVGGDGGLPPDTPSGQEDTPSPDEKPMGLLDHLNEMRWRLVRCVIAAAVGFCLCWAFVEPIFAVIVKPLLAVLPADGNAMYSTMPEAFFIRMFVACIAGLFVASPVIFYQIWAFISPGLYEEEKLFIVPVAIISAVFFVGGALFCYYIVFPFAFQFFMSYNTEQIRVIPRISDYVDFVLKLLIAFGLIFEMPLFAFFLSRMGVLTAAMMRQARRYAVLGIFIVAAILTPPDVVSQLLMALPMLVLYEISVMVAAVFGKKKKTPETDGADEQAETTADAETGEAPAARNAEGQ